MQVVRSGRSAGKREERGWGVVLLPDRRPGPIMTRTGRSDRRNLYGTSRTVIIHRAVDARLWLLLQAAADAHGRPMFEVLDEAIRRQVLAMAAKDPPPR